jgi:hypothetical protein
MAAELAGTEQVSPGEIAGKGLATHRAPDRGRAAVVHDVNLG